MKKDSPTEVLPGPLSPADAALAADPLPSWNDGPAKQSIFSFVEKVTTEGSPSFVPVPERIATFDNDGTLWCEQPAPVQAYFALDRVKALASQHPEWDDQEPFASLLKGDLRAALAAVTTRLLEIVMATHAGMTTVEFGRIVEDWIATARHPDTGRLFTEMIYQPMLELLAYLSANGFRNYIVTGGGIEFVRQWGERVYGVTPEQVIGSSIKTRFELRDGKPVLMRLPHLNFNNDKAGKPVTIHQHIGRAPLRHSATRSATSRCWNTRRAAAARGSDCSSCTMTRHANTRTARCWACPRRSSGPSRRRFTSRRRGPVGPWSA